MIWQIRFVTYAGNAPVLSPSVTLPWSARDVATTWTDWSTIFTLTDGVSNVMYRLEARITVEGKTIVHLDPGALLTKMVLASLIQTIDRAALLVAQAGTPPKPPSNALEGQEALPEILRRQDKA